jgi:ubiquinone/menaquinone biosynthesis C-methylase UbiE
MGFYHRHVVPCLIEVGMRQPDLMAYRARLVPRAAGRVLEVGVGSGHNLSYYGPAVQRVTALDLSPELLARAEPRAAAAKVPVELVEGSAEQIPLATGTQDTVLLTWTLCSIADPARALREIRRVLKPGGRLLFVEHGLSPDADIARWQHRLNPVWRRLAGGCNINRPTAKMVGEAGFQVGELAEGYANKFKIAAWMTEGSATAP